MHARGRASHTPLKRAYLAATVPRSVRSARAVIVPSEFVAGIGAGPHRRRSPSRSWSSTTGWPPPRPHARDRGPRAVRPRGPARPVPSHHLPPQEPRRAGRRLRPRRTPSSRTRSWCCRADQGRATDALRARIDDLGLTARVRWLGRIPAADLAGALPQRLGRRGALALRGLRPARGRGHGLRRARPRRGRHRPPGGGRRGGGARGPRRRQRRGPWRWPISWTTAPGERRWPLPDRREPTRSAGPPTPPRWPRCTARPSTERAGREWVACGASCRVGDPMALDTALESTHG